MIWYLIFCSSVYSSGGDSRVCASPAVMPSKGACHFVGKEMLMSAEGTSRYSRSNYKCVGVKKG